MNLATVKYLQTPIIITDDQRNCDCGIEIENFELEEKLSKSTSNVLLHTSRELLSSPKEYVRKLSGFFKDLVNPPIIMGSIKDNALVRCRSLDTLTNCSDEMVPSPGLLAPKSQVNNDVHMSRSSPDIPLIDQTKLSSSDGSKVENTDNVQDVTEQKGSPTTEDLLSTRQTPTPAPTKSPFKNGSSCVNAATKAAIENPTTTSSDKSIMKTSATLKGEKNSSKIGTKSNNIKSTVSPKTNKIATAGTAVARSYSTDTRNTTRNVAKASPYAIRVTKKPHEDPGVTLRKKRSVEISAKCSPKISINNNKVLANKTYTLESNNILNGTSTPIKPNITEVPIKVNVIPSASIKPISASKDALSGAIKRTNTNAVSKTTPKISSSRKKIENTITSIPSEGMANVNTCNKFSNEKTSNIGRSILSSSVSTSDALNVTSDNPLSDTVLHRNTFPILGDILKTSSTVSPKYQHKTTRTYKTSTQMNNSIMNKSFIDSHSLKSTKILPNEVNNMLAGISRPWSANILKEVDMVQPAGTVSLRVLSGNSVKSTSNTHNPTPRKEAGFSSKIASKSPTTSSRITNGTSYLPRGPQASKRPINSNNSRTNTVLSVDMSNPLKLSPKSSNGTVARDTKFAYKNYPQASGATLSNLKGVVTPVKEFATSTVTLPRTGNRSTASELGTRNVSYPYLNASRASNITRTVPRESSRTITPRTPEIKITSGNGTKVLSKNVTPKTLVGDTAGARRETITVNKVSPKCRNDEKSVNCFRALNQENVKVVTVRPRKLPG